MWLERLKPAVLQLKIKYYNLLSSQNANTQGPSKAQVIAILKNLNIILLIKPVKYQIFKILYEN